MVDKCTLIDFTFSLYCEFFYNMFIFYCGLVSWGISGGGGVGCNEKFSGLRCLLLFLLLLLAYRGFLCALTDL